MKRILVIAAILCSSLMVLQSCSSTKSGVSTVSRGKVSGNWILNNISFEGIPSVAVKGLFGEPSYNCFVGSTWNLTNSGNGRYTLLGGNGCTTGTQTIFWSVSPADQTFQFKKIFEGEKAKNVSDGYRLVLFSGNGDNLVLKSPIEYGSATAYVVLNFSKSAN
jgi:hypothetical protein